MNKAFLIGRLTRDPELRYSSSNAAIANFSIAIDRQYTNGQGQRETDFINIVVWRKQAENVAKYCSKGSQIAVRGSIQTRNYDAPDGTKRYVTEVVVDKTTFIATSKNSVSPEEQAVRDSVPEFDPTSLTDADLPF